MYRLCREVRDAGNEAHRRFTIFANDHFMPVSPVGPRRRRAPCDGCHVGKWIEIRRPPEDYADATSLPRPRKLALKASGSDQPVRLQPTSPPD